MTIIKSEIDIVPSVVGPGLSPFADYANSPEFSDIRFCIKATGTLFYGHKAILSAMSPWFKAIFTSGMRESYESVIDIEGVDPAIFSRLLHYCYTFSMDIQSVTDAQAILKAADQFQLTKLRDEALRYMRQEITESNIWDIWAWSDIYDCDRTRSACLRFVSNHFVDLIKNPAWLRARPNVLKMALQIDEGLIPSEEVLYESVVSWAKHGMINKALLLLSDDDDDDDDDDEEVVVEETGVGNTTPSNSSSSASTTVAKTNEHHHHRSQQQQQRQQLQKGQLKKTDELGIQHQDQDEGDDDNTTGDGLFLVDDGGGMEDRRANLAEILQYIRFPLIQPTFLVNVVETDPFVMDLPGVRDLLFEAYRHHAVGDAVGILDNASFRCKPRHIRSDE
ncbi:hypothetical protein BDB00DRAFT_837547 [Zychaea mexicana]|uniref:uncharacterized protein n=1 Tax=Zychaea mexicana TaxID=64656 RepID=UPI0022FDDF36|nr:uncharacterized protein BDB00DRAFT_837547 [Zychaea mexicana]KAI9490531.1 hypothetical protein BDB00DRAFT_837547 [Zychaea mexicana]